MDEFRDEGIEADLQTTLKQGGNVWVIGDVHGFNDTLRQLVASLELTIDDRVVLLGDLIDRGPDSFDVVRFAREDPRIHCIKGNHEAMMVENFTWNGSTIRTKVCTSGCTTVGTKPWPRTYERSLRTPGGRLNG